MRYLGLACDYDGTIAHHGTVSEETVEALERVRASGRKLLLVTGRELDDLMAVFPRMDLFHRVVAENGALLYRPETKEQRVLGDPPPEAFLEGLRLAGIAPLSRGQVIVATWEPHQIVVLELIRKLGLELQVIFNKGAVMVLPAGVNKASGLRAALSELALSPHNVVGVGDAENDHAFLGLCECSVAVANALPTLKERADVVTRAEDGAGVVEMIEKLVGDDLKEYEPALTRHDVLLGHQDGREINIQPYGGGILVAGPSGGGKSTTAIGVLERLAKSGYQFCLIDPEGDYEQVAGAVVLGDNQRAPGITEIVQLLRDADKNALVKLYGLPLADRPAFFAGLLARLQQLRVETGRPHWIMVDEAHHLLPAAWDPGSVALPQQLDGILLVTVHPDSVSPAALASVETLIAIGDSPRDTFRSFGKAANVQVPDVEEEKLAPGEALVWFRYSDAGPLRLKPEMASAELRRHRRKYAEGELGPDRSFYFRGPDGKLNLRAQNLLIFLQMADGVDDETWLYHLRQGDYSTWIRQALKDESLAGDVDRIAQESGTLADESRAAIRKAIEERYTGAA